VQWVLPEIDADKAIRLRDDYQNKIHALLSPDIFSLEIAHALTRAERQLRIVVGEAAIHWGNVMSTAPVGVPSVPLAPRAIQISSVYRVGFYDCLYVAAAENEGCELITSDDKLLRNLQPHFPFIIALSSLP
jgi:predicted nucleic acid-binding protein